MTRGIVKTLNPAESNILHHGRQDFEADCHSTQKYKNWATDQNFAMDHTFARHTISQTLQHKARIQRKAKKPQFFAQHHLVTMYDNENQKTNWRGQISFNEINEEYQQQIEEMLKRYATMWDRHLAGYWKRSTECNYQRIQAQCTLFFTAPDSVKSGSSRTKSQESKGWRCWARLTLIGVAYRLCAERCLLFAILCRLSKAKCNHSKRNRPDFTN